MDPARRAWGNRSLEEINATQKKMPCTRRMYIAGLLRPVIGEQLRSEHLWGVLTSSKLTKLWNLTSTYTDLRANIRNTYSTSAYNLNWPVPRTHTSMYCFTYVYKHVFFNWSVPRTQTCTYTSTGPYHTYKYVRSTTFFLVEYVELMCLRIIL